MQTPTLSPVTGRRKQPMVIDALTALAKQLGPGMKMPTALELARGLGVTVTTLDRCLGKLEERGIISRRQGSGIYVSDRVAEKRVGLVFGKNIFQPGFSAFNLLLLQHCERRAAEKRERFSFYLDTPSLNGGENGVRVHHDLLDALQNQRLDGLLMTQKRNSEQELWMRQQGLPVVVLSGEPIAPGSVWMNAVEMVRMGCRELLARGCRTLGLFGMLNEHRPLFIEAMNSLGVPIREEWVISPGPDEYPEAHVHEQMGRDFVNAIMSRCGGASGLPDGIVMTDDILTMGACAEFESQGVSLARDLQVASHSNRGSTSLAPWENSLVRMEFDPQEIVEAMFSTLETLMSGQKLAEDRVIIHPKLVLP